ncbi:putative Polycomb complex protein BMI-1 [Hypsibius exemplaris]|uniref:Polycomb complex protein BMI-1 n=1 Tax=Hypsibius exemplaris TaxID=2072580 RepID=A0A1W0WMQ9_HYPEX|nr:putative Polycomb complex protein BMI-1 [Hypsibius exemplaris]
MDRILRLPTAQLYPHLRCELCEGFLIDAVALPECHHEFCKACIVNYCYLQGPKGPFYCPIEACKAEIHKTRPLSMLKNDTDMQTLIYKLFPSVYKDEMANRRRFYEEHPQALTSFTETVRRPPTADDLGTLRNFEWLPRDVPPRITVLLTYTGSITNFNQPSRDLIKKDKMATAVRSICYHTRCETAIGDLKHFIAEKFHLMSDHMVIVLLANIILQDDNSLADVVRYFSSKEVDVLHFNLILSDEASFPDIITRDVAVSRLLRTKAIQRPNLQPVPSPPLAIEDLPETSSIESVVEAAPTASDLEFPDPRPKKKQRKLRKLPLPDGHPRSGPSDPPTPDCPVASPIEPQGKKRGRGRSSRMSPPLGEPLSSVCALLRKRLRKDKDTTEPSGSPSVPSETSGASMRQRWKEIGGSFASRDSSLLSQLAEQLRQAPTSPTDSPSTVTDVFSLCRSVGGGHPGLAAPVPVDGSSPHPSSPEKVTDPHCHPAPVISRLFDSGRLGRMFAASEGVRIMLTPKGIRKRAVKAAPSSVEGAVKKPRRRRQLVNHAAQSSEVVRLSAGEKSTVVPLPDKQPAMSGQFSETVKLPSGERPTMVSLSDRQPAFSMPYSETVKVPAVERFTGIPVPDKQTTVSGQSSATVPLPTVIPLPGKLPPASCVQPSSELIRLPSTHPVLDGLPGSQSVSTVEPSGVLTLSSVERATSPPAVIKLSQSVSSSSVASFPLVTAAPATVPASKAFPSSGMNTVTARLVNKSATSSSEMVKISPDGTPTTDESPPSSAVVKLFGTVRPSPGKLLVEAETVGSSSVRPSVEAQAVGPSSVRPSVEAQTVGPSVEAQTVGPSVEAQTVGPSSVRPSVEATVVILPLVNPSVEVETVRPSSGKRTGEEVKPKRVRRPRKMPPQPAVNGPFVPSWYEIHGIEEHNYAKDPRMEEFATPPLLPHGTPKRRRARRRAQTAPSSKPVPQAAPRTSLSPDLFADPRDPPSSSAVSSTVSLNPTHLYVVSSSTTAVGPTRPTCPSVCFPITNVPNGATVPQIPSVSQASSFVSEGAAVAALVKSAPAFINIRNGIGADTAAVGHGMVSVLDGALPNVTPVKLAAPIFLPPSVKTGIYPKLASRPSQPPPPPLRTQSTDNESVFQLGGDSSDFSSGPPSTGMSASRDITPSIPA